VRVVLGLGGNLGDPLRALVEARSRISSWATVLAASRVLRTSPVGPIAQAPFLNAALLIDGDCSPSELLGRCHELEAAAGRDRVREARWGPRALDIDLLVARDVVHRGPRLKLPHARFHERAFALVPAAEVAGEWCHPLLGRTLAELAADALRRDPGAVVEVLADGCWRP
jgi:2-amino-4-hydroxy-6-hydroxymethyldihydropteridine diphosphokinase